MALKEPAQLIRSLAGGDFQKMKKWDAQFNNRPQMVTGWFGMSEGGSGSIVFFYDDRMTSIFFGSAGRDEANGILGVAWSGAEIEHIGIPRIYV